jgi:hypothetical protein
MYTRKNYCNAIIFPEVQLFREPGVDGSSDTPEAHVRHPDTGLCDVTI